jgi:hypothetical protein
MISFHTSAEFYFTRLNLVTASVLTRMPKRHPREERCTFLVRYVIVHSLTSV